VPLPASGGSSLFHFRIAFYGLKQSKRRLYELGLLRKRV